MKTRFHFLRLFALWLALCLGLPTPLFALRPQGVDNAGLEEEIQHALSAGLEEPPQVPSAESVPTVTRVSFGGWKRTLNRWLFENGVLKRETEHLGEGDLWTRLVFLGDRIPLVELLVDEDWVDRQPAMRRKFSKSSVPTERGMPGRPLVQLVINRYRREDGQEVLLIERVQILRGPQKLEHGEELEARSELVELIGRWGKENGIPVYLIRPEVMRDVNPELRERTIQRNYYDPVNQRNPRLWETVRLRVVGSDFLNSEDQEDNWFLYQGEDADTREAGLEESARKVEFSHSSQDTARILYENRKSLEPLGLGQWMAPLTAFEAVVLDVFLREGGQYIHLPLITRRPEGQIEVRDVRNFTIALERHEPAVLLNLLYDLGDKGIGLKPPAIERFLMQLFSEMVLAKDREKIYNVQGYQQKHVFWEKQFQGVVRNVLNQIKRDPQGFGWTGLIRLGDRFFQEVPTHGVLLLPLAGNGGQQVIRLADREVIFEWTKKRGGKLKARLLGPSPDAGQKELFDFFGKDSVLFVGGGPGRTVLPEQNNHLLLGETPYLPSFQLRMEVIGRQIGRRTVWLLMLNEMGHESQTYIERFGEKRAADQLTGADRKMQEALSIHSNPDRRNEAVLRGLAVLESVVLENQVLNDWASARSIFDAVQGDAFLRELSRILNQRMRGSDLPSDFLTEDQLRKEALRRLLEHFRATHEETSPSRFFASGIFVKSEEPEGSGLEEEPAESSGGFDLPGPVALGVNDERAPHPFGLRDY